MLNFIDAKLSWFTISNRIIASDTFRHIIDHIYTCINNCSEIISFFFIYFYQQCIKELRHQFGSSLRVQRLEAMIYEMVGKYVV